MVRAPLHFHGRIPVPEVAPLTYRDSVTHLELVYELSQYLKNILHPSLQSTVDQVVADAERLLDEANTQYVDGVQEFQRIHDAFMSDVNTRLMALNDTAVSDLVDDETSLLGQIVRDMFASRQRVNDRSVVPQDYGAVGDYDGTSGTDNYRAFQDAINASPEGGTVYIPAGRYYLTDTLIIDKSIALVSGGAGHLTSGGTGTQLVFAPGVSGIHVRQDTPDSPRPSKYRIENLYVRGAGTRVGDSVGVLIQADRGQIHNLVVENFGSHGLFIRGGTSGSDHEPYNATVQYIANVRAYANGGDGVRLEGNSTNASLLLSPDVVYNHGWGINLERTSMNKIVSPHAFQDAEGSPGAYRDNGTANSWDWAYSERGKRFHIGPNASSGSLEMSTYGRPEITHDTISGIINYRITGLSNNVQNFLRVGTIDGLNRWGIEVGSSDTIYLRDYNNSETMVNLNRSTRRTSWATDITPDGERNLGMASSRWNTAYVESVDTNSVYATGEVSAETFRLDRMLIRRNGNDLEISVDNGGRWSKVVTE